MIENSNNDSAQALWDEVGGGPGGGQATYNRIGVSDFHPDNADGWGWSTISPRSMVHLLYPAPTTARSSPRTIASSPST